MPGPLVNSTMTGITAWRGTVTKDNHLYGIFRSNPQMASDVMTVLMSQMHLPTLDTYLSREVPVKEYEDDSDLFWDVVSSSRRNIPLIEARRCDGTPVASGGAMSVSASSPSISSSPSTGSLLVKSCGATTMRSIPLS